MRDYNLTKKESPFWKGLIRNRDPIFQNMSWLVGNGTNIHIWKDNWIPGVGKSTRDHCIDQILLCSLPTQRVSDLILDQNDHLQWNLPILHKLWDEQMANIIQSIPLGGSDIRCWDKEEAGKCTIKAIYKLIQPRSTGSNQKWTQLWKLELPSKIKFFLWRVLLDRLPTKDNLAKRMPNLSQQCSLCNQVPETSDQLFASCSFTRLVWEKFPLLSRRHQVPPLSIIGSGLTPDPRIKGLRLGSLGTFGRPEMNISLP